MNGLKLKDNQGEDSVSFLPTLKGQRIAKQREAIIHHSDQGKFAIRRDKWVLIMDEGAGSKRNPKYWEAVQNPGPVQLFDLEKDPSQTFNLQAQNPEIVSQLKNQLINIIENGRSTAGNKQKNDDGKKGWPHYDELKN
jgi:arylsulfatase A